MKKIFVVFAIMLTAITMVNAGDIPESLLREDEAQIYFGEVVSYQPDKDAASIEISPVKKIKGNIRLGTKQIYIEPEVLGTQIETDKVYLIASNGTERNPYIFEPTSYDTSKLRLKGVSADMWQRFEEYLNYGEYEVAELERIKAENEKYTRTGKKISLLDFLRSDIDGLPVEEDDVSKVVMSIGYEKTVYVDKDEFFKAADEIQIEDVEGYNSEKSSLDDSWIYIEFRDSQEKLLSFAMVSDSGAVDRNGAFMSRLPEVDYLMEAEDYEKLFALLPEEAKRKLPPLDNNNYVIYLIVAALAVLAAGIVFLKRKKQ